MMRILSWTPTLGCDKMQAELSGTFSAEKFSSALSSSELAGCLKRKRSVDLSCAQTSGNCATPTSVSTTNAHIVHTPVTSQPAPVATTPVVADVTPTPTAPTDNFADATDAESTQPQTTEPVPEICPRTKMDLMRDTISSQLSLDILMKHRELRLIDQELAKCQAALEQLRRCTEIPFPGMHQPSEDVSNGTGAAIKQKGQKFQAKSPAPWGVTNGPYTKHYAKWLLPDCRFDGGLPDRPSYSAASTPASARSTRGHFQDFAQLVGKTSRAQRAAQHMSLPAGYVEPKQKPTGPMILKRKSDGKMVKLICPDCGRLDFGSAQGFINHCRIGHQRNFASHDAAAEGCGEPVEYDEAGNMKGVPQQPEPAAVSAAAPAAVVVQTPGSTHVHPLVRSAKLLPPVKPLPRNARGVKSKKAKKPIVKVGTPSPDAPNLSAFMQDKGIDLDLNKFVTEAKASIEPEGELEYDHDDMDIDSPVPQVGGRHPQTGAKLPAGKGLQSRQHRPSHSNNACSGDIILHSVESDSHSLVGMLPSPTNDSTQAPSLIDDDEEMDPQSPPSSSDEIEDREIDFHIQDDDHLEDTQELRGPEHLPTPPGTCAPSPAPLQRPPQAATFITAFTAVPQRQLSFVHETGYSKTDDGPEKKRRKMMGN